jgi:hypothetical protein
LIIERRDLRETRGGADCAEIFNNSLRDEIEILYFFICLADRHS